MNNIPRIVLSGGVSGGHTFPLIAVAQELRKLYPEGVTFLFIGSGGRFRDDSLAKEGIEVRYVLSGKVRRYFSFLNIVDVFKVPIGFFQSLWHLFHFMPDAVFAKGASGSVPVVLAAALFRIPVVIQDSDAVAGRATRFLARYAARIAVAYERALQFFPREKTALLGNPVRQEILKGEAERGAAMLGLSPGTPTVLFLGGSLGARALNQAVLALLPELRAAGIQVIHQTGEANLQQVLQAAEELGIEGGYKAKAFFSVEELADCLALAGLVVSRAGANTISELAACGKACILVPLPSAANDEQRANAYEIAELGGALIMEEANLGEHMLLRKITQLLNDAPLREKMGENLRRFYHPLAGRDIALGIHELIRPSPRV